MNSDTFSSDNHTEGLRPSIFYFVAILIFLLDQASKEWMQRFLTWEQSWPRAGAPFALTLTQNTGGAWGIMPRGNGLFIAFAVLAVVALLVAYHRSGRHSLSAGTAFALAFGGACGNLLDRLRYGYVVDFFDVRLIHWPIFNVADSAISCAIVLLLVHFLRVGKTETAAVSSPEPGNP